jgi:hypothetical protein
MADALLHVQRVVLTGLSQKSVPYVGVHKEIKKPP